ncbi:hypothetical protein [Variovorax sp. PAMC 28711]|nr:hypothetical protein [Variovorax sp. PAMC 28711]
MRAVLNLPMTGHVARVIAGAIVWGCAESIALARSRWRRTPR